MVEDAHLAYVSRMDDGVNDIPRGGGERNERGAGSNERGGRGDAGENNP